MGPVRESARERVLEIITDNMPRFRYLNGYEPVEQYRSYDGPRSEWLSDIHVPTLIISGALDNTVAKQNSRNWAEGIADAKLVVFPDAAYLVHIDQVDDFNQTVLDFLGNL